MNTNSQLLNFLREMLNRAFTKSPMFFRIWQWASGILLVMTGIPELLEQLGVALPEPFSTMAIKAVAWASAGMYFMSLFPTQSNVVAATEQGDLLKQTDSTKLPFTAKSEERSETRKDEGMLNPDTKTSQEITELTVKK